VKRILLIDLSGLYWANWHATADQELSEAFERTVAKVTALAHDADHVAVCCDAPPYWRREVLPEYKAQREAAPPQAVEQLTRVKERLESDGFLLWSAKGFEADDVIATATKEATARGDSVVIASNDKDLHQLVSENVTVLSTMSGVRYTPEEVFNKHGVAPGKMGDYLTLVGDTSDNVPGVPKIGPKTAAALLNEFGTLEKVFAEVHKPDFESAITKPVIRSNLIESEAMAYVARQVITLRTDVPIRFADIYEERDAKPIAKASLGDAEYEEAAPPPKSEPKTKAPKELAKVTPTQALAVRPQTEDWSLALEPTTTGLAWKVSGDLLNSRLYSNLGSQEAIFAVLLRGRALGLDATTALAVFHNVKGKLVMHADLIEALVLRSGKAVYFEMVHSDARKAVYETKRVGSKRAQTLEFTIEDAYHAKLVGKNPQGRDGYGGGGDSNWDKYRATMLRHRCKTQLARAVYADVVLGLYSPDEMDAEFVLEATG